MNLAQVKKLKVGDKFRRPSTNGHDNGWREYTVTERDTLITCVDQHGYYVHLSVTPQTWEGCFKDFMKPAELTYQVI